VEFLLFLVKKGCDGFLKVKVAVLEWDDSINICIFEVFEIVFDSGIDEEVSFS
jgi:hypothetical protein